MTTASRSTPSKPRSTSKNKTVSPSLIRKRKKFSFFQVGIIATVLAVVGIVVVVATRASSQGCAGSCIAIIAQPKGTGGFWTVGSDGKVEGLGGALDYGDLAGKILSKPIVGAAATPSGKGYWLVGSDGGIFAFGDAPFKGSTGNVKLNKPIVGMSATPSGQGYWLVASDGGIFAYGDAPFKGSTGNVTLNKPIVGMAATPSGQGYWLVASDGGIFAYGDAPFKGSAGSIALAKPIVGMARSNSGQGYWLVAADGGVFAYGDAPAYGSLAQYPNQYGVIGMGAVPGGGGYWLAKSSNEVHSFGSAARYWSNACPDGTKVNSSWGNRISTCIARGSSTNVAPIICHEGLRANASGNCYGIPTDVTTGLLYTTDYETSDPPSIRLKSDDLPRDQILYMAKSDHEYIEAPKWSADGKQVIFAVTGSDPKVNVTYKITLATPGVPQILFQDNYLRNNFSVDSRGQSIAWDQFDYTLANNTPTDQSGIHVSPDSNGTSPHSVLPKYIGYHSAWLNGQLYVDQFSQNSFNQTIKGISLVNQTNHTASYIYSEVVDDTTNINLKGFTNNGNLFAEKDQYGKNATNFLISVSGIKTPVYSGPGGADNTNCSVINRTQTEVITCVLPSAAKKSVYRSNLDGSNLRLIGQSMNPSDWR